jgi:hypothetical protein
VGESLPGDINPERTFTRRVRHPDQIVHDTP